MEPNSHDDEEYQVLLKILGSWAAQASHYAGICFDYAKPTLENKDNGLDPFVRFVSNQLYIDCHLTSESVLLLIHHDKEWDADLLTRSVIEGTVKYVYMLNGAPDERLQKTKEYWTYIPRYNRVKRSERLKRFFKEILNPDSSEWHSFRDLILSDEEEAEIRRGTNKEQRKAMEQRWSFSEIIKYFGTLDDYSLRIFSVLMHGYGMSSHLLHKDGDGVGIVWDRFGRSPERYRAAKLSHAARVIRDICAMAEVRALTLAKVCNVKMREVTELRETFSTLFRELDQAHRSFNEIEYPDLRP